MLTELALQYYQSDSLRRRAVVSGETEVSKVFHREALEIAQEAFARGISLDDFLDEVERLHEEISRSVAEITAIMKEKEEER